MVECKTRGRSHAADQGIVDPHADTASIAGFHVPLPLTLGEKIHGNKGFFKYRWGPTGLVLTLVSFAL
ncbi:MAG: hypothetical protein MI747_17065 [Desulfobacterales bacterium]|nr:hypothetical protein [Desulfobacterales bacterium]